MQNRNLGSSNGWFSIDPRYPVIIIWCWWLVAGCRKSGKILKNKRVLSFPPYMYDTLWKVADAYITTEVIFFLLHRLMILDVINDRRLRRLSFSSLKSYKGITGPRDPACSVYFETGANFTCMNMESAKSEGFCNDSHFRLGALLFLKTYC